MGRKHYGKRRNCSLRAIFPFPSVFIRPVLQTRKNPGLVWERVKTPFSRKMAHLIDLYVVDLPMAYVYLISKRRVYLHGVKSISNHDNVPSYSSNNYDHFIISTHHTITYKQSLLKFDEISQALTECSISIFVVVKNCSQSD